MNKKNKLHIIHVKKLREGKKKKYYINTSYKYTV